MNRLHRDKLTLYRRHAASCPTKNLDCDCPLWVHGRLKGAFIRQSLNTRSLAMGDLKRREMLAGKSPTPPTGGGLHLIAPSDGTELLLADAEAAFLEAKKSKSSQTQELYQRAASHFRAFAEAHRVITLGAVTPALIQQYFNEYGARWAQRTKIGRLTHLRVWFNYTKEMDWITTSPAAKKALTFSKPDGHAREPFSREDIARILTAVETLPAADRDRARALILLLLYSGMRISDATFTLRRALHPNRILDYVVIKTRKPIALPIELAQVAVDALRKLPASRVFFFQPDQVDDYREALQALYGRKGKKQSFAQVLGQAAYDAAIAETTALVVEVLARAGVTGACHRFRDTFAVNLLVGGTDIFTVSQALGHSDVKITANHYLNLVPGYRERMSQATRVLNYHLPQAV